MKQVTLVLIFVFMEFCCMSSYSNDIAVESSHIITQPIEMTSTTFDKLPIEQQKILASSWSLEADDFSRYLWIIQNTPNGLYYADKHLDPSWILGFNAKDDDERKKFAIIAIKNERARIEGELAFQRIFTETQQKLYPNELPIQYSALTDNDGAKK